MAATSQSAKRRNIGHTDYEPANESPIYDSSAHRHRGPRTENEQLIDVLAQIALPEWVYTGLMLGLIFGGCCSNVYALEAIIKDLPESGTLITLTQFALVALLTLPSQIEPSSDTSTNPLPFTLSARKISFQKWFFYTMMFMAVNFLNNLAFGYSISVPVHIILRSGGSITTMLLGYLVGKRYTRMQVFGVLLLTAGVMLAALSDAEAQGKLDESSHPSNGQSFATGLVLLLVAQTLSAYMGLYCQQIYAEVPDKTKPWRENLFYSHLLSLPMFLPFTEQIQTQSLALFDSPALSNYLPELKLPPSDLNSLSWIIENLMKTPVKIILLAANALTQYICIRGVNILSARSSALTVTIVLNIRKLVSLMLSVWIFGNKLAPGVLLGAVVVFTGAGIYGSGGAKTTIPGSAISKAKEKENDLTGATLNSDAPRSLRKEL